MERHATRRPRIAPLLAAVVAVAALMIATSPRLAGQVARTGWTVLGFNNLGMHCMDADFSVFATLPPYNTLIVQLVDAASALVTSPTGVTVTYQAVADPSGSINTTSAGKTNFWTYVQPLFGVTLPVNVGLLNHNMPGTSNTPQPMIFDSTYNWFIAEGIPITPYDDASVKNPYPLMRVVARDSTGAVVGSSDIVLPVSDEMSCSTCHRSGSGSAAAQPSAGWVNNPHPELDYRQNILRLHDDRQLGNPVYTSALAAKGFSSAGLYASALGGKPVTCAACHLSEALAGSGITGIPQLTTAMHSLHANVIDPMTGQTLGSSTNRSACYRCHPGSVTRCLRGVMGNSVAADGSMEIQCQNCHGSMAMVGSPTRTGWLQEPMCQNCHTGTAVQNNGQIRYTSTLDTAGTFRVAVNTTFATQPNVPATGFSLYRFSAGHGGLQCSTCHGSTHAEFPSSHRNDNLYSTALQGHVGTIGECGTCHTTVPSTVNGGPHGMHPVGQSWVSAHPGAAEGNAAQCQACHGTDYRGTVLSRSFAVRTLTAFGTKTLFRGAQVGCYMCHNGPGSDSANSNIAPVAANLSASTSAGVSVAINLAATDANGDNLTYRIVSQPANGTVGLSGTTATYFPFAGFSGTDTFTYAAWDGSIDSNLATVTVTVGSGGGGTGCTLSTNAIVPSTATVGTAVTFSATASPLNCTGSVAFVWSFGDGSANATSATVSHAYAATGTYTWTLTASIAGVVSTRTGSIVISSTTGGPQITQVTALNEPFRIRIDGSGFQVGVRVYIGSSTTPWPSVQRVSSSELILSGEGLRERFPRGTAVRIRVVNPDGSSATTTFTRSGG